MVDLYGLQQTSSMWNMVLDQLYSLWPPTDKFNVEYRNMRYNQPTASPGDGGYICCEIQPC